MNLISSTWTNEAYEEFILYLKSLAEDVYRDFSQKLTPNTPNMWGLRVPVMRKIAKEITKGNYAEFLIVPKGDFHEEIVIEGLVMAQAKCEYPKMLEYMKKFADKIYNWAICDTVSFKQIKKYKKEFWKDKNVFIFHENPWVVRFGIGCLLEFYLDDEYIDEVLDIVESVDSDFYYVQMMQAWLIATAFAKYREKTLSFLKETKISDEVFRMTVRKIRDSNRVDKADKDFILTIR
ncbi:MAG: DNA alkylation repair protein [Clostridia bacterium]|nr:DNA alkylation repair protein [Clostridia bacterium]